MHYIFLIFTQPNATSLSQLSLYSWKVIIAAQSTPHNARNLHNKQTNATIFKWRSVPTSLDVLLTNMGAYLQAHIVCPSEGKTREAYRVYSVTRYQHADKDSEDQDDASKND